TALPEPGVQLSEAVQSQGAKQGCGIGGETLADWKLVTSFTRTCRPAQSGKRPNSRLQMSLRNCSRVILLPCAWPVRMARAASCTALSSTWDARKMTDVCRIAPIMAKK